VIPARNTFALRYAKRVSFVCSVLAVAGLCALLLALSRPPAPGTLGAYKVRVGGYYSGEGTAVVAARSVHFNIQVRDETGRIGRFRANNLPVVDNYFRGQGTVMGHSATIEGRIDPADGQGGGQQGRGRPQIVRSARVLGSFQVSDGHSGRIAGGRSGGGAP